MKTYNCPFCDGHQWRRNVVSHLIITTDDEGLNHLHGPVDNIALMCHFRDILNAKLEEVVKKEKDNVQKVEDKEVKDKTVRAEG